MRFVWLQDWLFVAETRQPPGETSLLGPWELKASLAKPGAVFTEPWWGAPSASQTVDAWGPVNLGCSGCETAQVQRVLRGRPVTS